MSQHIVTYCPKCRARYYEGEFPPHKCDGVPVANPQLDILESIPLMQTPAQRIAELETQLATAVELLELVLPVAWLADREHRTELEIETFLATVRDQKKDQP